MKKSIVSLIVLTIAVLFSGCTVIFQENSRSESSGNTSQISADSSDTESSNENQQSSEASEKSMNTESSEEGSTDMKALPQIESITIYEYGSMAYNTQYEILRTEKGVRVSKYEVPWGHY